MQTGSDNRVTSITLEKAIRSALADIPLRDLAANDDEGTIVAVTREGLVYSIFVRYLGNADSLTTQRAAGIDPEGGQS